MADTLLSPELAQWLRAEGHDAVHANDRAMNRSPDSEILQFAARTGRVVITADLLRGGNFSEAESQDCVRRVLMSIAHAELPTSIVVVDRERTRRRRVPI